MDIGLTIVLAHPLGLAPPTIASAPAAPNGPIQWTSAHSTDGSQPSPPSGPSVPATVSSNGRYLLDQNGSPILMLADQLLPALHNGTLADIETVIADRAGRGYNGLWMCLMPDSYIGASDALTDNAGNQPFTGSAAPSMNTPSGATAVAAYWSNVDSVVAYAAGKGITLLLCPIEPNTGGILQARNWGNAGCNAFGQFLGNRYKNSPNILWYHANDFGQNSSWVTSPPSASDDLLLLNVLAGIKTAGDTHLHTVELNYNLSVSCDDSTTESTFTTGWRGQVDCNQAYTYFQTYSPMLKGYRGINSNDAFSQAQRYTPKPVFLGESNYEGADNLATGHVASPYTLRCQNYWTLLAGGLMGQVWGNKILHHFSTGWQSNLATAGAIEAGIWAAFFRSIAFQSLVPDGLPDPTVAGNHTFVTSGYGTYDAAADSDAVNATNNTNGSLFTDTYATAALTPDGSLGVVYTPVIQGLVVNMAKMRGSTTARWFDPTSGSYTAIGTFANSGSHTFTPSGSHPDGASDWVLVLTA